MENGNPNERRRAEGKGGWVRVERKVRPSPKQERPEHALNLDLSLLECEEKFMPTSPKENTGVIA